MKCTTCSVEMQKFGKHRNGLQRYRCGACKVTRTEDHYRLFGTMTVPEDKALLALQLLIEGTSVRSTERISGLHRDTILRLLVLAGERCIALMDAKMRNLKPERIQADEIWSYVAKKQRAVRTTDSPEMGDAWVFIALDAQTKLIPSYVVGKRNLETTYKFVRDLKSRIVDGHRFQLTTDGYPFYIKAVENVFAGTIDFAQLVKIYGNIGQHEASGRYSPAPLIETIVKIQDGRPDRSHISTSYIERQNLTIRMGIRRFTRLTNGFSKKLDNHKAACALHFAYYNFCRIHKAVRATPAMTAGITDRIWTMRELIASEAAA